MAQGLIERADELPGNARLAWGAAFLGGRVRWAPVPVVAEFERPEADDPGYLMDRIGAGGLPGDAREAIVDYVSTPSGDGVRVFALARSEQGTAYGRVGAALRLEQPGADLDVLLTTRVFDPEQMAVIGFGVEQLMNLIAAEGVAVSGEASR